MYRPPLTAPHHPSATSAVRGGFLIEALVAVVVISIAAAGLFTLVAQAIRASSDALARAEAAQLVAGTLAKMSAEDPSTLSERYDAATSGPGFVTLAAAAKRLPGVTDSANVPVVLITPGPSLVSRRVAVTVLWQLPASPAPHRASMATVVTPR